MPNAQKPYCSYGLLGEQRRFYRRKLDWKYKPTSVELGSSSLVEFNEKEKEGLQDAGQL